MSRKERIGKMEGKTGDNWKEIRAKEVKDRKE